MTEQEILKQLISFVPFLAVFPFLMILLTIWSIVWKGMALWRAGRRGDMAWFIALLIINTIGILEILYLFVFSRDNKNGIADNSVITDNGVIADNGEKIKR